MAVKASDACFGCSACSYVCPIECIEMTEDDSGFIYPKVDSSRCVSCGKCETACPVNRKEISDPCEAYCYSSGKRGLLQQCASGGAFTSLAESFIREGGAVAGVADDTRSGSKFVIIDKVDDLYILSGSKYYQCNLSAAFISALVRRLKSEQKVLFCGTPCQVAAIRNSVAVARYDNLWLVDIVCQGVPSGKSVSAYRREVEESRNSKLINHRFRAKLEGHEGEYVTMLEFEDGDRSIEFGADNLCARAFMYQVSLRESCYQCPFAQMKRCGDLTLGDYWSSQLGDGFKKGSTSLILANNERGDAFVAPLGEAGLLRGVPVEKATEQNIPLHHPVRRPVERSLFYPLLDRFGFSFATRVCAWRYTVKKLIKNSR